MYFIISSSSDDVRHPKLILKFFDFIIAVGVSGRNFFIKRSNNDVVLLNMGDVRPSFKFLSGIEYEKTYNLFDSYVHHFYKIKKESKGATRFVAKMHLNQLYGYFGRSLETLETININNSEITHYLCNYVVKNILEVNKDISILLVSRGFDYDVDACIDDAFESIGVVPSTSSPPVLGNVAIASAVTSYARIIMMPVKNEFCCYTDTDSVITTVPLPSHLMGDDLGLFKDELNGDIISKGVFLGIKQYGYVIDCKEKSVFAGVPRNSIKYAELEYLSKGGSINKPVNDKFFKSMKTLKMKILNSSINIKANNKKILKDNRYGLVYR